MYIALLLASCTDPVSVLAQASCDGPTVPAGQARVCRLGAGDVPEDSGARAGDWRLQSAVLDVIIRAEQAPITRLEGTGGTVAALRPSSGADPVLELLPTLAGGWFSEVELDPVLEEDGAATMVLSGLDATGAPAVLTYRLRPDARTLELDGALGLTLVPRMGAEVVGAGVERGEVLVLAPGALADGGGEVVWTAEEPGPLEVSVGPRSEAIAARWPERVAVSGLAEGADWIEARVEGVAVVRLPVAEDGSFAGEAPAVVDALVAVAEDRTDGSPAAPGTDLDLDVGAAGDLRVRAVDQDGTALPALLDRCDADGCTRHVVPPGGARLPVAPGVAETVLWAGPAYEAVELGALEVLPDSPVEVSEVLRRVGDVSTGVVAELGVEAWPDAQVRRESRTVLAELAGRGVGYAVLVADDEVAQDESADPWVRDRLEARTGSRAASAGSGAPVAWPWSPNGSAAAHGAAPWMDLSALDLLAVMRGASGRAVVIDTDWLQAAAPPVPGDLAALALRLDGPADGEIWRDWLDRGLTLPVVGPWTWVTGVDPEAFSEIDVEAGLYRGRTVASTGPRIHFEVAGAGPGESVAAWLPQDSGDGGDSGDTGLVGEVTATLRVESPAWAPVEEILLHGPDGRRYARWTAAPGPVPLDIRFDLEMPAWLVVEVRGPEASWLTGALPWAMTSPVWRD